MRARVLFAAFFVLASACGTSQEAKEARERAAEGAYLAEHLRCVEKYETNAEINECRADVRARWGVVVTTTKDGGR